MVLNYAVFEATKLFPFWDEKCMGALGRPKSRIQIDILYSKQAERTGRKRGRK